VASLTLDQLLAHAQNMAAGHPRIREADFAKAVLDLLGESLPCGWETPEIREAGTDGATLKLPAEWPRVVSPDDARAQAAALLRGADEAEAGRG
jgi:hypothetical protein